MGKIISEPKTYAGKDLETIFFRPAFSGKSLAELGVKVMLNTPVPVKMQLWKGAENVLKAYSTGFTGGNIATKYQKTISLEKIKAELSFDPTDYFEMVNELVTNSANVNLGDLQGTPLEKAETYLFREAIKNSIYITAWLGKKSRASGLYPTFDGWLQRLVTDSIAGTGEETDIITCPSMAVTDAAETLFTSMFRNADTVLQDRKNLLAYFVTNDVLFNYEDTLKSANLESSRTAMIDGVQRYMFNGIPIIPVNLTDYLADAPDLPQSFALLSVRENLVIAVNTNQLPDGQVRMWYNEDEIENRQRAIFMMSAEYVEPKLCVLAAAVTTPATPTVKVAADNTTVTIEWTASVQTSIYNVYKDGVFYSTVTTDEAAIVGLTKNTTYAFTVKAVIGAAESPASAALSVTTTNV
ncbi:MAG: hypothetical protein WCX48_08505 [Bacteroidales bacterium]